MRTRNQDLKLNVFENKDDELKVLDDKCSDSAKLRKKSGDVQSQKSGNTAVSSTNSKDPSFSFDKLMKSIVHAFQDKNTNGKATNETDEIEVIDTEKNQSTSNVTKNSQKSKSASVVNKVNEKRTAKNICSDIKASVLNAQEDLIEILDDDNSNGLNNDNHFTELKYKNSSSNIPVSENKLNTSLTDTNIHSKEPNKQVSNKTVIVKMNGKNGKGLNKPNKGKSLSAIVDDLSIAKTVNRLNNVSNSETDSLDKKNLDELESVSLKALKSSGEKSKEHSQEFVWNNSVQNTIEKLNSIIQDFDDQNDICAKKDSIQNSSKNGGLVQQSTKEMPQKSTINTGTDKKEVKSNHIEKKDKSEIIDKSREQNNTRKVTGLRSLKRVDYDEIENISDTVKTRKSRIDDNNLSDKKSNITLNQTSAKGKKKKYEDPFESDQSSSNREFNSIMKGNDEQKVQQRKCASNEVDLILIDDDQNIEQDDKNKNKKDKVEKNRKENRDSMQEKSQISKDDTSDKVQKSCTLVEGAKYQSKNEQTLSKATSRTLETPEKPGRVTRSSSRDSLGGIEVISALTGEMDENVQNMCNSLNVDIPKNCNFVQTPNLAADSAPKNKKGDTKDTKKNEKSTNVSNRNSIVSADSIVVDIQNDDKIKASSIKKTNTDNSRSKTLGLIETDSKAKHVLSNEKMDDDIIVMDLEEQPIKSLTTAKESKTMKDRKSTLDASTKNAAPSRSRSKQKREKNNVDDIDGNKSMLIDAPVPIKEKESPLKENSEKNIINNNCIQINDISGNDVDKVGANVSSPEQEGKLPHGWRVEVVEMKRGVVMEIPEIYVFDPKGKRFRSRSELEKYCKYNPKKSISKVDLNLIYECKKIFNKDSVNSKNAPSDVLTSESEIDESKIFNAIDKLQEQLSTNITKKSPKTTVEQISTTGDETKINKENVAINAPKKLLPPKQTSSEPLESIDSSSKSDCDPSKRVVIKKCYVKLGTKIDRSIKIIKAPIETASPEDIKEKMSDTDIQNKESKVPCNKSIAPNSSAVVNGKRDDKLDFGRQNEMNFNKKYLRSDSKSVNNEAEKLKSNKSSKENDNSLGEKDSKKQITKSSIIGNTSNGDKKLSDIFKDSLVDDELDRLESQTLGELHLQVSEVTSSSSPVIDDSTKKKVKKANKKGIKLNRKGSNQVGKNDDLGEKDLPLRKEKDVKNDLNDKTNDEIEIVSEIDEKIQPSTKLIGTMKTKGRGKKGKKGRKGQKKLSKKLAVSKDHKSDSKREKLPDSLAKVPDTGAKDQSSNQSGDKNETKNDTLKQNDTKDSKICKEIRNGKLDTSDMQPENAQSNTNEDNTTTALANINDGRKIMNNSITTKSGRKVVKPAFLDERKSQREKRKREKNDKAEKNECDGSKASIQKKRAQKRHTGEENIETVIIDSDEDNENSHNDANDSLFDSLLDSNDIESSNKLSDGSNLSNNQSSPSTDKNDAKVNELCSFNEVCDSTSKADEKQSAEPDISTPSDTNSFTDVDNHTTKVSENVANCQETLDDNTDKSSKTIDMAMDSEGSIVIQQILELTVVQLVAEASTNKYSTDINKWDDDNLDSLRVCYSEALYQLCMQQNRNNMSISNLPNLFFDIWKQKHPTCELKVEELLRLRNEDSLRTKLNDDKKQEEPESQENKEMPFSSDDEKVIGSDKSDTIENSYNKYSSMNISDVPVRDKDESSSFEFIVDEDYETLKESPSFEVENWKVEHCLKLNILAAVCGSLVIQSFQGTTEDPLPVFCPLFPKKKKSPCQFLIASETGWELLNHVNKLHIDLIQPNEEWKMCSDCDLYLPSQEVANYHFQLVHEEPAVDPKVACKDVNIDSLSEWQHVEAVPDEDNDKRLGELINQYYEQEIERIKFVEEEYKRKIVLDKQKAKELEEERKRQKEIEFERKLQAIDDKREKESSKVKIENSQNDDIVEINDDSMCSESPSWIPNIEKTVEQAKRSKSKTKKSSTFVCNICDKDFSQEKLYKSHYSKSHLQTSNPNCLHCNKSLPKKEQARVSHLEEHTGIRPYKCRLCDFTSHTANHVIKHVTMAHKQEGTKRDVLVHDGNKAKMELIVKEDLSRIMSLEKAKADTRVSKKTKKRRSNVDVEPLISSSIIKQENVDNNTQNGSKKNGKKSQNSTKKNNKSTIDGTGLENLRLFAEVEPLVQTRKDVPLSSSQTVVTNWENKDLKERIFIARKLVKKLLKKGLKVSELNIKTSKDLDEIEIPIAEEWTRKMIPIFLNQLKGAKNGNSLSSNISSIEYNSSNKRPCETVDNLLQNDDIKRIKQENVDNLKRSSRHNNNYPFDITSITEKTSSTINKGREKSGLDSIMASLNSISENPIGVRNLGGLF